MAKAKKTIKQRVADLKVKLDRSEKKLKDTINTIATSTQTSSAYWNQIQKEVVKIYEEFRTTWTQFANTEIPIEYRDAIREQIAYVKGLKFKPPVNLDYRTFINTNINVQSISSVVGESVESFFIAIEGGEREINRLLRTTQQNLVNEKAVNKAIDKGLFEKGTTFQAKKELEKTLLKKMLDEKFVTIIDKNGKTRFYNVKSYAEMVARTKIREAQTIGVANTAIAYGTDLVQVSSHNTTTPFDAQFEGLIFSLSGNDPNFPKATFLPPFHPSCLHSITIIFSEVLERRGVLDKMIEKSNMTINTDLK